MKTNCCCGHQHPFSSVLMRLIVPQRRHQSAETKVCLSPLDDQHATTCPGSLRADISPGRTSGWRRLYCCWCMIPMVPICNLAAGHWQSSGKTPSAKCALCAPSDCAGDVLAAQLERRPLLMLRREHRQSSSSTERLQHREGL
jgi:hypothetical protein